MVSILLIARHGNWVAPTVIILFLFCVHDMFLLSFLLLLYYHYMWILVTTVGNYQYHDDNHFYPRSCIW